MPADPETTAAINRLADRMEAKVDQLRAESKDSSQRIYARIDQHADENRKAIGKLSESLVKQETTLDLHRLDDADNFRQLRKAIGSADKDRRSLWKRIAAGTGLTTAGGAIVAVLEWLRSGGGQG